MRHWVGVIGVGEVMKSSAGSMRRRSCGEPMRRVGFAWMELIGYFASALPVVRGMSSSRVLQRRGSRVVAGRCEVWRDLDDWSYLPAVHYEALDWLPLFRNCGRSAECAWYRGAIRRLQIRNIFPAYHWSFVVFQIISAYFSEDLPWFMDHRTQCLSATGPMRTRILPLPPLHHI